MEFHEDQMRRFSEIAKERFKELGVYFETGRIFQISLEVNNAEFRFGGKVGKLPREIGVGLHVNSKDLEFEDEKKMLQKEAELGASIKGLLGRLKEGRGWCRITFKRNDLLNRYHGMVEIFGDFLIEGPFAALDEKRKAKLRGWLDSKPPYDDLFTAFNIWLIGYPRSSFVSPVNSYHHILEGLVHETNLKRQEEFIDSHC